MELKIVFGLALVGLTAIGTVVIGLILSALEINLQAPVVRPRGRRRRKNR